MIERGAALLPLTLPLSGLYRLAVAIRNRRYDRDPRAVVKLPAFVVSVGNLTVGGSGKSPLVAAIARDLLARGRRVAVLSRGYGRRSRAPFVLVSDGGEITSAVEECGDEPYELASAVRGLAVAVSPGRVEGGRKLIERMGAEILVLDDGFQHRSLHRDLDVVCFDSGEPPSGLRLLPAGRLREPLSSLRRASAVAWTGWREEGISQELRRKVSEAGEGIPEIRVRSRVVGFSRLDKPGEDLEREAFREERVGVLLGIARPQRVLESLAARVVFHAAKPDHHWWSAREVDLLAREAKRRGASALLTTRKDAVKMRFLSGAPASLPVFAIAHEAEILDSAILASLLETAERR